MAGNHLPSTPKYSNQCNQAMETMDECRLRFVKRGVRAAILSMLMIGSIAAQNERTLRIFATADNYSSIPNNKVKVTTAGQLPRVMMSDSDGWYPVMRIPSEEVTIALRQKATDNGLALGQIFTRSLLDPQPGVHTLNLLMVAQPVLRPVVFDSTNQEIPAQSPDHSRWYAYPASASSEFLFDARVGMLLTAREIDAFENYYGVDFGEESYKLGLVLEVSERVDLGDDGLEVGVDCRGHDLGTQVGADVCFVATTTESLGSSSLWIQSATMDPTIAGLATLQVGGSIGVGFNIILLRSNEGTSSFLEYLAQPEPFGPATVQVVPPILAGGSEDCEPEIPRPSGAMACDPKDIQSDPGCPPGSCGIVTCSPPKTNAVGPALCGGSGAHITFALSSTVTSSWSVEGNISFGTAEAGGSETGEESDTSSVQVQQDFGNGNGCGECTQPYMHYVRCQKYCYIHREHRYRGHLRCRDSTELSVCFDTTMGNSPPCPRKCD